jgi:SNF2 family DNA or RNA helicase
MHLLLFAVHALAKQEQEEEPVPGEEWKLTLPTGRDFKGNTLRDYQVAGVRWMLSCYYRRRSCILADEMGLGKTVQVRGVCILVIY